MISHKEVLKLVRVPGKRGWIPLVLLVIGIVLITLQMLANAIGYVRALVTSVEHPSAYTFTIYDEILHRHVRDGLIDYKAVKADPDLARAVRELERTSPDKFTDPHAALPFWINAHNLLVIKNVVDNYPIISAHRLARSLSLRKMIVGGQPMSVTDIKSQRIEPLLMADNPHALFLVCDGAMGSPPILSHAIDAKYMEQDVLEGGFRFLNNPKNVAIDLDSSLVTITPFIQWNWVLFSRQFKEPWDLIFLYLDPMKKIEIGQDKLRITVGKKFNWWLNDTALKGKDEPRDLESPDLEHLQIDPNPQGSTGGG